MNASSIKDISMDGVTLRREEHFNANQAVIDLEYYLIFEDSVNLYIKHEESIDGKLFELSVADFKTLNCKNWQSITVLEVALKLSLKPFHNSIHFISLSTYDSNKIFMEGITTVHTANLYNFVEHILNLDVIIAPIYKKKITLL